MGWCPSAREGGCLRCPLGCSEAADGREIHCIARSGIRPDAHDSAGEQRTVREGDAFTIFYQEIASRAVNRTAMTGHPSVRSGRLPQYPVTDGTDERAWPVWTARCPMRTLPRLGVHYRNRSPGRRPLVGCSHRRYARASWRWRRSRSWART